eukprot:1755599-Prorocentrum_lima.AAC.1
MSQPGASPSSRMLPTQPSILKCWSSLQTAAWFSAVCAARVRPQHGSLSQHATSSAVVGRALQVHTGVGEVDRGQARASEGQLACSAES